MDTANRPLSVQPDLRPVLGCFIGTMSDGQALRCFATQHEAFEFCPASSHSACELLHIRCFFARRTPVSTIVCQAAPSIRVIAPKSVMASEITSTEVFEAALR